MKNLFNKNLAARLFIVKPPSPALLCIKRRNVDDGEQHNNGRIVHDDTTLSSAITEDDSVKKLLQEIRDLLKTRVHNEEEQSDEADKEDEIKKDWMVAAAVLDRICAIVFTIVFIGGTLIFLVLFFAHS